MIIMFSTKSSTENIIKQILFSERLDTCMLYNKPV